MKLEPRLAPLLGLVIEIVAAAEVWRGKANRTARNAKLDMSISSLCFMVSCCPL
jgi:hypothetical protein